MTDRTIPQRELRNDVAAILRGRSGDDLHITVRGRPVARLGPPEAAPGPRRDVDRATLRRILALPVDPDLARDLEAEEAVTWPDDARFGAVSRADRLEALAGIEQSAGRVRAPEELDRLVEEEREAQLDALPDDGNR